MSQSAPGIGRHRNRELQWLRALAASCVVVYHAGVYLERFAGETWFASVFDGRLGFLGVAIFFALSGYLMAEILPRTGAATFLAHRVVRIYPVFFLILGALYVARRKWGDFDLLALTLVPVGSGPTYYLGVEWTLLFELTFYVVLYLVSLLGLARHLPVLAALWLVATVPATLFWPERQLTLTPTIDELPFMAVNAAFAGGLLIPTLLRWGVFRPSLAAVGVLVAFGFSAGDFGWDRWIASICAVILVGLCVAQPGTSRTSGRCGRLLDRYGDWSYALYLCHVPLIIGLMIGRPALPPALLWLVGIAVPLVVAIPFGVADVRIYRRTRRWVDAAPSWTLHLLAAAYVAGFLALAAWATISNGVSTRNDATSGQTIEGGSATTRVLQP